MKYNHYIYRLLAICQVVESSSMIGGNATVATKSTASNEQAQSLNLTDKSMGNETFDRVAMIGLAFCLTVFSALILFTFLFPKRTQSPSTHDNTDPDDDKLTPEEKEQRMKERKSCIQKFLRTSKVVEHDHWTADEEQLPSCHVSMKDDNNRVVEGEPLCCQICMEEWQVGDVVAYSGRHCQHVFHFRCIESWLLQHNDCPFCRQIMLAVDEEGSTDLEYESDNDSSFCICHGLSPLERDSNDTQDNSGESEDIYANVVNDIESPRD